MRYQGPYDPQTGAAGQAFEAYTNGDPASGVEGSIPPAQAIEHPMREIGEAIDFFLGDGTEGSGQDAADLTQLRQAIQKAIADGVQLLDFLDVATNTYQGSMEFPGGIMLKFGRRSYLLPAAIGGEVSVSVVFATAFPGNLIVPLITSGDIDNNGSARQQRVSVVSRSQTGFEVRARRDFGDAAGVDYETSFVWLAVGYV